MKNKVFGVALYADYEGGGVVAVFSSFEKAKKYADDYSLSLGQQIELVTMIIDEPDTIENLEYYRRY